MADYNNLKVMSYSKVMHAKITSKGQVTIPKPVRDVLQSQEIEFVLEDDGRVLIQPGQSARGALADYATADARARETDAWPRAAAEKHGGSADQ
jgi:AbrB family looped-hinge helix DNA binding protein